MRDKLSTTLSNLWRLNFTLANTRLVATSKAGKPFTSKAVKPNTPLAVNTSLVAKLNMSLADKPSTKLDTQSVVNTELLKLPTINTCPLDTNKAKLPTSLEDQELEDKDSPLPLVKVTSLEDQVSEDQLLPKTSDTDLYTLS